MKPAFAALALIAGCTRQPVTPAHEHPALVSLNPCTDAILAQVVDPAQLLAISAYSHDPRATSMPLAQARRFRAVWGSAEEVLALRPDVVVTSPFLQPATRRAFARLGISVESVGAPATVRESEEQVRRLAYLAGHPDRGEQLVRRIERALAAARTGEAPLTALVWQQGGIVPGPHTLIAQLARNSGFVSHSAARGLGQGAYLPLEHVLADPPRVILAAGGERMLTHPVLRSLRGVHYERLGPALLFCGGPTIVHAAARLGAIRRSMAGRGGT